MAEVVVVMVEAVAVVGEVLRLQAEAVKVDEATKVGEEEEEDQTIKYNFNPHSIQSSSIMYNIVRLVFLNAY